MYIYIKLSLNKVGFLYLDELLRLLSCENVVYVSIQYSKFQKK